MRTGKVMLLSWAGVSLLFGCGKILGFGDDRVAPGEGSAGESPMGAAAAPSEPTETGGAQASSGGGQGAHAGDMASDGGAGPSRGGSTTAIGGVAGAGGAGNAAGQALAAGNAGAAGDGGSGGSGPAPCAGHAGPKMVRVGSYCIDRTEVTKSQYREFLVDAAHPLDPKDVASCEWKTSFTDNTVDLPTDFDLPVGNVDWCDAKAYCEWAGKRLCGKIGGGALRNEAIDIKDADRDEWYNVCSQGGQLAYVYGQSYEANVCNADTHAFSAVEKYPGCVSVDGVFDLLGSVWEWQNACGSDAGKAPDQVECAHRGGSAYFEPKSCLDVNSQVRSFRADDLGFRCCSD